MPLPVLRKQLFLPAVLDRSPLDDIEAVVGQFRVEFWAEIEFRVRSAQTNNALRNACEFLRRDFVRRGHGPTPARTKLQLVLEVVLITPELRLERRHHQHQVPLFPEARAHVYEHRTSLSNVCQNEHVDGENRIEFWRVRRPLHQITALVVHSGNRGAVSTSPPQVLARQVHGVDGIGILRQERDRAPRATAEIPDHIALEHVRLQDLVKKPAPVVPKNVEAVILESVGNRIPVLFVHRFPCVPG